MRLCPCLCLAVCFPPLLFSFPPDYLFFVPSYHLASLSLTISAPPFVRLPPALFLQTRGPGYFLHPGMCTPCGRSCAAVSPVINPTVPLAPTLPCRDHIKVLSAGFSSNKASVEPPGRVSWGAACPFI